MGLHGWDDVDVRFVFAPPTYPFQLTDAHFRESVDEPEFESQGFIQMKYGALTIDTTASTRIRVIDSAIHTDRLGVFFCPFYRRHGGRSTIQTHERFSIAKSLRETLERI